MGMYSTLVVRATLLPHTPQTVIDPLRWLVNRDVRGDNWTKCPYPDDHPFFKLDRHHQIGEDYESYWGKRDKPISTLERNADGSWSVVVRSHCKNYDGQFQSFLEWIDPWVHAKESDQIGFYRSEEQIRWYAVRKGSGIDYATKLDYAKFGEDPLESTDEQATS